MKRNLFRTALLLTILVISVETTIAVNAHAEYNPLENNQTQIITVDKNREGDYVTIQEAINNAPDGSTIIVKAGTYSEIINIKKKISLVGEDKDKTIINPISEKNKYAIRLGAPEVTIRNLSITNRAPGLYTTGVHVSASKTKIQNCNIYDTPVGIAIWSSDNIVDNCNFWGCKDEGIALLGSKHSTCNSNKITNCTFQGNCDGIELQHSSNNIITNCEFYENTHTGIDAIASSNDKNTISNCKIYNNEVHGIYLSSSSDNKIINCLISNNNDGDIITTGDSHNNEIKNSIPYTPDVENNTEKQTSAEASPTYYESSTEKHEKNEEDIISRVLNIISNLNIHRIISTFYYFHNF